uniref:DUF4383 domain-containing protein n=1 Tax=Cyanothece sp. (strain PCC 7425 / ATCC 29141) TaxID=395961 RepID=B8HLF1_CYAP4
MQSNTADLLKKLNVSQRYCALGLGLLFFFLGIAGFLPGLVSPSPVAAVHENVQNLAFFKGYGNLFGLFPTNALHNAVHMIVGLLGIAAATSFGGSIAYNRGFAIAYAAIAIMGLLPFSNTTFGLMPIYGNNVWFNALTALVAAYVGFVQPEVAKDHLEAPTSST